MSLKYFTRRNALNATTRIPYTTNFNHLRSFPRAWIQRQTKGDPKVSSVRPQDRIKYWNIVPGDQIRLRGDETKTTYEVLSINRLNNRVYVKGEGTKAPADGRPPPSKSFHYSKCQVCVGEQLVGDPKNPDAQVQWTPVFATRVGTSQPVWDHLYKRWKWSRFAVSVDPKPQDWARGKRLEIPWPEPQPRAYPKPTEYETPLDVVSQVTFEMPTFEHGFGAAVPTPPSEQEYLDYIYNPRLGIPYDPSKPFEIFLSTELANPHSRAKKLQRHKAHQARLKDTYLRILQKEKQLKDGRTVRQVQADATFKFRELVKAETDKKKKARWMHTSLVAERERKANKKAKKEERLRRRLNELVLTDAPNQVIPKAVEA